MIYVVPIQFGLCETAALNMFLLRKHPARCFLNINTHHAAVFLSLFAKCWFFDGEISSESITNCLLIIQRLELPNDIFPSMWNHFEIITKSRLLTLNVRGPSSLGLTRSIPWLLMPWLLTSPGQQQPWYWLCRICRSWSYVRKDLSTCVISMWSNDIKM